jgi:hypothetical protein
MSAQPRILEEVLTSAHQIRSPSRHHPPGREPNLT